MTTSPFRRAKLVPFDAGGRNPQESRAIALDFNPETLTLKVSGGEQRDRSRRGRQQVQNVGASKATLAFECVFDSTRPRDATAGDGSAGGEEMLDVRTRTKPIADLLQVFGSGREQAPRRVQFRWGTLIFNGVITIHQEVFDYFSPSGVPLRSKVNLTLTEQEFRYEVSANDAAQRRQAVEQASADARSQAAAANAGRLIGDGAALDLSTGFALSADFSLNVDVSLSAQLGMGASLGLAADLGRLLGAGVELDASAAIDLFGAAALTSGMGAANATGSDLGRSGIAIPLPSPGLAAAGVTPNPWAPDGPAPGSRAAALAGVVASQRVDGVASVEFNTGGDARRPLLPVRGSPPLSALRTLDAGAPLFAARVLPCAMGAGERRPRWESLTTADTRKVTRSCTGCTCGASGASPCHCRHGTGA